MQKAIVFILLFIPLTSIGQRKDRVMSFYESVDSFFQVRSKSIEIASKRVGRSYPKLNPIILSFTNLDTQMVEDYGLELDEIRIIETDTGKYIAKCYKNEVILQHRVRHIYINGRNIPRNQVDSIRSFYRKKLDSGVRFNWLAKEYGQSETGGDLGWFNHDQMVDEFSDAIVSHKVGEIFDVNVEENKWYYLVWKTHEDRTVRQFSIILIKYRD